MSENITENNAEEVADEPMMDASQEIKYLDPEAESIVDDSEETLQPIKLEEVVESSDRPRISSVALPWWLMILLGTLVAVIMHWLLRWLGSGWFWSERLIYFLSLAVLLLLLIASSWLLGRQGAHALRVYIINLSIGLLTGVVISVMLFLDHVAFWTFFNLIVQPIDAMILAALGSWLGTVLFINKK